VYLPAVVAMRANLPLRVFAERVHQARRMPRQIWRVELGTNRRRNRAQ
jgi:hypothetical protein